MNCGGSTGYPSPPHSEDGEHDAGEDKAEEDSFTSEDLSLYTKLGVNLRFPSPPLSVSDIIMTIAKPGFPIRVSGDGPRTFSLEVQRPIMRWR